jgi:hypothetical protein
MCFRNSLIGSVFRRLFCGLSLALLMLFDRLCGTRLFSNCLLSSLLGSRRLRLLCLLSSCLGSGFLCFFAFFAFFVFFGFTGIGPAPQFEDLLAGICGDRFSVCGLGQPLPNFCKSGAISSGSDEGWSDYRPPLMS